MFNTSSAIYGLKYQVRIRPHCTNHPPCIVFFSFFLVLYCFVLCMVEKHEVIRLLGHPCPPSHDLQVQVTWVQCSQSFQVLAVIHKSISIHQHTCIFAQIILRASPCMHRHPHAACTSTYTYTYTYVLYLHAWLHSRARGTAEAGKLCTDTCTWSYGIWRYMYGSTGVNTSVQNIDHCLTRAYWIHTYTAMHLHAHTL